MFQTPSERGGIPLLILLRGQISQAAEFQTPSERGGIPLGNKTLTQQDWAHVSNPFRAGRDSSEDGHGTAAALLAGFQTPSERGGIPLEVDIPVGASTFTFQTPSERGGIPLTNET